MPIRLTETAIGRATKEAAETKARSELADAGCPGLRLRITPAGARTWLLGARDKGGRPRRFTLGSFPDMGIADAREAARAMRQRVKVEGADPIAERRRVRAEAVAARDGIGTLTSLIDLYERQHAAGQRRWEESRRMICRTFAPFLNRPLGELTLPDLQLATDSYKSKYAGAAAARCLRPILKWASGPGRKYVSAELVQLSAPATPRRRDRVLDRSELSKLLPALRAEGDRPHAVAMRFMLYTLARREEVGGARWRDVDMQAGVWTIGAERVKNRQQHVVPLPRQDIDLLRSIRPGHPDPGALIFATSNGGTLANWDRVSKRVSVACGLAKEDRRTGIAVMIDGSAMWTRHDLRRTGATMLGEMGEMPDIIEAALNHVAIRSALAATYNRSRYRPQVAMALQRLADALDGIEEGAAKLVPMRRAAWGAAR